MTLVERGEQFEALREILSSTVAGTGNIAVVSGPVASGKTELLRAVSDEAARAGMTTLRAVAASAERMLPLALIGQLLPGADVPHGPAGRIQRLVAAGAEVACGHEPGTARTEQAMATVLHDLCRELLDLAAVRPLFIGIDDIHHADVASLQCLLYLSRRIDDVPILLAVNAPAQIQLVHPLLQGELLRHPRCHLIRLSLLSAGGVAEIVRDRIDGPEFLEREYFGLTGGNPLLVHALVTDHQSGTPGDPVNPVNPAGPVVGETYSSAVLSCLYRSGSRALECARGLALLGPGAPASRLGRLVRLTPDEVQRTAKVLALTGLLGPDGWFRHPCVQAAILEGMAAADRAALHRRAAEILHEEGADAATIARHLVAAAHCRAPWMVDVLNEAAEASAAQGELTRALDFLRLARHADLDDDRRLTTAANAASVEWRLDPSTAARHLPHLAAAARDGRLPIRQAPVLVKHLLWRGCVDQAMDALRDGVARIRTMTAETALLLTTAQLWLSLIYPEVFQSFMAEEIMPKRNEWAGVLADPRLRAVDALAVAQRGGRIPEITSAAEQVLQQSYLDDLSVESIIVALASLVYTDQLQSASAWCDRMLDAAAPRALMWQALFTAVRASISGRQGDLRAAEAQSRLARSLVSDRSWGVAVGWPLATEVFVALARGRHDAAAEHLAKPVPEPMFQTPFGLHYMHARGCYYAATGRHAAALHEFLTCGELMRRWGVDRVALVPWRGEAALVLHRLGRTDEARRLAEEQLAMSPAGQPRSRGTSLRVLAALSEPRARVTLLREARESFAACGDQFQLAGALGDLAAAYRAIGEPHVARTTAGLAARLAAECGADAVVARLELEAGDAAHLAPARAAANDAAGVGHAECSARSAVEAADGSEEEAAPATVSLRERCRPFRSAVEGPAPDRGAPGPGELSDAERRVAELAARGLTNRQIASRLYVTISTVEQHLTRIYRKLKVASRTDLPTSLLDSVPPF
ncbi:hypothetical protein GCM10022255_058620 [Dactylosporangium darangshiense]|uniref:HTH luxR-type domain-containing protein n=1 Tax=Dactylosporangium darangshiense TaxID=579108 RepID=A0ABP8DEV3_9ACTN